MENSGDLDSVIRQIHDAFPSMGARKDLARRPHSFWVEERPKLPLLLPKDVVEILPFVLVDMANSMGTNEFECADQVVYFLDVQADLPLPRDGPPAKSAAKLRARAQQEREASFTEINPRQAEAIFRWLGYIAKAARYVTYETELPRASEYWRRRSGIATQPD